MSRFMFYRRYIGGVWWRYAGLFGRWKSITHYSSEQINAYKIMASTYASHGCIVEDYTT